MESDTTVTSQDETQSQANRNTVAKREKARVYRQWVAKHREQRQASQQAWYQQHKERERDKHRAYYTNHQEQETARSRAYYQAHHAAVRARQRRYYRRRKQAKSSALRDGLCASLPGHALLIIAMNKHRDIRAASDPEKAREGLRNSAGALHGVATDALKKDIQHQRKQDSHGRPAE
jgi:hypothetical protein